MRVPIPDAAARARLFDRAVAADLALSRALAVDPPAGAPPRPTAGDIHRAASLGDGACRARVEAAARRDAWVAQSFAAALGRSAVAVFAAVHAASTGAVTTRRAGGYAIEVRVSERRPDRCFLTIDCPPGGVAPGRLVLPPVPERAMVEDLALPAPSDGVIQVILPGDHPVIAALADPDRPVHLV